MKDDLLYWVWLSSLPNIGAKKGDALIKAFGDPKAIWEASELELARVPHINRDMIHSILDQNYRRDVKKHIHNLESHGIRVCPITDENYPTALKMIYDPPTVLFFKGSLVSSDRCIAVVGSRNCSPYGASMAEFFSRQLASLDFTIVSGMARGVDTIAHQAALKAKRRTVAVLGCGLDRPYPVENKSLMNRIIEEGGAVISEFLPGTMPLAGNFPARNRIISGLSRGVVVVEAGEKSGSLITAGLALEQGREVFSIPGNINTRWSRGTNKLIKDGAKMVTSVEDILEELNAFNFYDFEGSEKVSPDAVDLDGGPMMHDLDKDERKVVKCIIPGSIHIDIISQMSGIQIGKLNSILIMLELKGVIRREEGNVFRLRK